MFYYLRRKMFYSFKLPYFYTQKYKETKCNGLHFIKLRKFRKQVQGLDKSSLRVSKSVQGCYIYCENMILICLTNGGFLANPGSLEIGLVNPESPEFHMILWPGP